MGDDGSLFADLPALDRQARALIAGAVDISADVEQPLRRVHMPEMPAGVRGAVANGIASAVAQIAGARATVAQVGEALRTLTHHAGDADKVAGLPWWAHDGGAAEWTSTHVSNLLDDAQKNMPSVPIIPGTPLMMSDAIPFARGLVRGTSALMSGSFVLARVGLETNAFTALPMHELNRVLHVHSATGQMARGLSYSAQHPVEAGKAMFGWDQLAHGKWKTRAGWAGWAGYQTPNALLGLATGGVGEAAEVPLYTAGRLSLRASRAEALSRGAMGRRIAAVDTRSRALRVAEDDLKAAQGRLNSKTRGGHAGGRGGRSGPNFEEMEVQKAQLRVNRLKGPAGGMREFDAAADATRAARGHAEAALHKAFVAALMGNTETLVETLPDLGERNQ